MRVGRVNQRSPAARIGDRRRPDLPGLGRTAAVVIGLAALGLTLMVLHGLVGHDDYPRFDIVVGSVGLLVLGCITAVFVRFLRYGFATDTQSGRTSRTIKYVLTGLMIFAITLVVAAIAFHVPFPDAEDPRSQ